ncbi:hypothetical protein M378DRAFT_207662 [Amanita muscaria Koide BX008]|uniref:Uncharacterized protein n=1 Tax=Amanita muscaria (strain Koide BX008) TaxID=946122 RepID=A0A0C2TVA4_AMAMK|nr:hypothetical protein M378DRAFT_207662 [Amanita muscaria Koide BX008]
MARNDDAREPGHSKIQDKPRKIRITTTLTEDAEKNPERGRQLRPLIRSQLWNGRSVRPTQFFMAKISAYDVVGWGKIKRLERGKMNQVKSFRTSDKQVEINGPVGTTLRSERSLDWKQV